VYVYVYVYGVCVCVYNVHAHGTGCTLALRMTEEVAGRWPRGVCVGGGKGGGGTVLTCTIFANASKS
jgi:hypothetical protein